MHKFSLSRQKGSIDRCDQFLRNENRNCGPRVVVGGWTCKLKDRVSSGALPIHFFRHLLLLSYL